MFHNLIFAIYFELFLAPFLDVLRLPAVFFEGTLPPAFRASERPIAIACLRLVTFFPEPERNLPRFIS